MRTKQILIMGCIAVLVLLILGVLQFIQTVQAGAWSEDSQAVETAYARTIMTKATKVDTFVGTEAYKIVYGEDAIGQQMIVWISDQDIHTEYIKDGLRDKDLRAQFALREPTASLLRILPGKLNDMYVWELYYKKPGASGKQTYFYSYIKFADGTEIDTYNLGEKRSV